MATRQRGLTLNRMPFLHLLQRNKEQFASFSVSHPPLKCFIGNTNKLRIRSVFLWKIYSRKLFKIFKKCQSACIYNVPLDAWGKPKEFGCWAAFTEEKCTAAFHRQIAQDKQWWWSPVVPEAEKEKKIRFKLDFMGKVVHNRR